ncbi:MAG: S8 family serine peptidase [Thermomicrobiales bacterium]|nr:S8 family serine peptidase [Thermomicrobiales bacterium]
MLRRISLMLFLLSALVTFAAPTPAIARPDTASGFVPGELLVKFRTGVQSSDMASILRDSGGRIRKTVRGVDVQVVSVSRGTENSRLEQLRRNPLVEYAELNGIYSAVAMPNDPRVGEQWQYENTGQTGGTADADIDAFAAWDVTQGSPSVAVAIVDTGIDSSHADLAGKVVKSVNFSSSSTAEDRYGHGTHVAGIVAATTGNGLGVAGTCPACVLYNVKVLGDDGNGSWGDITTGINWALDNGAKVINLSLGGSSGSYAVQSSINYAWSKGVVIVAAAGNSNTSRPFYPAYYSSTIAVAATTSQDQKASFSNFGSWVDVAAPGQSILSTTMGSTYGLMSGTSMAAPFVSGLAGLLWSTPYGTSKTAVRSRLESTADKISGTGSRWANGRINVCKAVGGSCDQATTGPTVMIASPVSGSIVTNPGAPLLVQVAANDVTASAGSLSVSISIDGGTWNTAAWNASSSRYELSWNTSAAATGPHAIRARAVNATNDSTITDPTNVRIVRPVVLPGLFQAEDYGGFFDSTTGNSGGAYWDDDVDKEACSDGSACFDVGWIESGEWLSYAATVAEAGNYTFSFRVATPNSNATVRVLVDDADVSGQIAISSTGGWQTWANSMSSAVALPAGSHTVKLVFGYSGSNPGYLFNLNSVSVESAVAIDTPPSVAIVSPAGATTVAGSVNISATAGDDVGVTKVAFFVDNASIGVDTNGSDGWGVSWTSSSVGDGAHVLTATATDTANQSTTSAAITVDVKNINSSPEAVFTATCDGLSCAFNASGSRDPDGSITRYDWTFGDSSTGSGVTANHTYSSAGSYTVTLAVTDNAGASTQTSQTVNVAAPAATMRIGDLDGAYSRFWFWASLTVSVRVETSDGGAVANGTVSGTFRQGAWSTRVSCITGTAGICTLSSGTLPSSTRAASFSVDSVTHATLAYDASGNHDPDGDSDGTTINFTMR